VKKIRKLYTPFSYRKDAIPAFKKLFSKFSRGIIVLSYSSNGFPDAEIIMKLMKHKKGCVDIHQKPHRYHFGTHTKVERNEIQEFLLIGY